MITLEIFKCRKGKFKKKWVDGVVFKKKCISLRCAREKCAFGKFNYLYFNIMSKPRWIEILSVAVQILKLVIVTAADIVDDGRINGSAGDIEHDKPESHE